MGKGMDTGDHVVVNVDNLLKQEVVSAISSELGNSLTSSTVTPDVDAANVCSENYSDAEEEQPLVQSAECRICQEEDHIKNLDTPCACRGSLKYAHRACVQRWCNEKRDTTCEICHEPYKSGYTAPPQILPDETTIDISDGWNLTGNPLVLHDPRFLAVAAAQRRLLEAEYENEYAATNASGSAICRSAALIMIALLLLRHVLTVTNSDGGDDDAATIFSLFLLRAAGFLLPCYVLAWAISALQHRRQRQEAAALAAAEVAFIMQAGQGRPVQIMIAPDSPATPQHELQE